LHGERVRNFRLAFHVFCYLPADESLPLPAHRPGTDIDSGWTQDDRRRLLPRSDCADSRRYSAGFVGLDRGIAGVSRETCLDKLQTLPFDHRVLQKLLVIVRGII